MGWDDWFKKKICLKGAKAARTKQVEARKPLPHSKGISKIQGVVDSLAIKNLTSSALGHIHFWSKIQPEIRSRWISMVTEGRVKKKKLENQLKT
ncbi:Hypothetical predicted protein [Olea europaea subsp. europaea]|uniref:Uncharacterized protein n=1 Tax=Olea europaea subsp. europaea TaxID=158383 RepID=A0A8S0UW89_OLEEU|nr:Hypothetical predicted protein [Olea europaea subsp. europaea]